MQRMSLVQPALWLALTLALVGSLRHVAWAFATLEGATWQPATSRPLRWTSGWLA
ncbi:MAG: hypothetical protein ACE5HA_08970 [Anaerolineae bacterium]